MFSFGFEVDLGNSFPMNVTARTENVLRCAISLKRQQLFNLGGGAVGPDLQYSYFPSVSIYLIGN